VPVVRPEDRLQLEKEIRQAQVICLVYSVEEPLTFERISSYWLPYVRSLGANIPVVLVGNKIDMRPGTSSESNGSMGELEQLVLPLMNDFKEVETCVECSAKTLVNIPEVFYFAQKSVLYPTSPLYDSREQDLKKECKLAFERIFRLSDLNKDGLLDDEELNLFQEKCFGRALTTLEIAGVKELVIQGTDEGTKNNQLTMAGFLYLHKLFIQKGRLETAWNVLRRFGYDDGLALREDFVHPNFVVPKGMAVELSPAGYQFLAELFAKFDRDGDGALAWEELEELFATTEGNPWIKQGFPETSVTNEHGFLTLQGFLAQWSMSTALDHTVTLKYLAYLGYPGEPREALRLVKGKGKITGGRDRSKRDVFCCLVLGAIGCGKTALLRSLLNKAHSTAYVPGRKPSYAVNSVDIGGLEKYLVMVEHSPHNGQDLEFLRDELAMDAFDVICLVYDSADPNSFAYITALKDRYGEQLARLPVVVVGTKSDLDRASQVKWLSATNRF